jgi:hypothetical protein
MNHEMHTVFVERPHGNKDKIEDNIKMDVK